MYLPVRVNRFLLALPEMAQCGGPEITADQLDQQLAKLFLTRTAGEWEDFCSERGFEGVAHYTSAEWMHHPLAKTTDAISEFTDPELGPFRGFSINPRLSRTPGQVRAPRARPNEHRVEILKELDSRELPIDGAPVVAGNGLSKALEGIRVVDLGIILAGPFCGRTLAEFGADVIKIDSIHRNPVNWHNDVNRAKRMILLDLKKQDGLDIFWKLLDSADVVIENFRLGVAEKLGIGYEQVNARRTAIVYGSVNAFGRTGEYSKRPGREVLAQAVTGMTLRLGGNKPVFNPFNANDYITGLMCTYGILLSLLERQSSGRGQFVSSALIYGATLLQTTVMQDYAGKVWEEAQGQRCLGTHALYRAYKTQDDWIFLAAKDCSLSRCPDLADLADRQGADLELALEQRFSRKDSAEWLQILVRSGLAAERVILRLVHLHDDSRAREQGLVVTRPHDGLGLVTTAGPGIKLSGTPVILGRPAPRPGADAAEILREIGMEGEMARLIREGVVVTEGIEAGGAS
jgi:crotonobetainyl-CoA:carnitine CoA-transferase CaiB-like acyl-CoA transferase